MLYETNNAKPYNKTVVLLLKSLRNKFLKYFTLDKLRKICISSNYLCVMDYICIEVTLTLNLMFSVCFGIMPIFKNKQILCSAN